MSKKKNHIILEILNNNKSKIIEESIVIIIDNNQNIFSILLDLIENLFDEKLFVINIFIEKNQLTKLLVLININITGIVFIDINLREKLYK